MSEKILGQASEVKQGEFTQPGIVTPRFFDKETGKMVDAGGNEIKAPVVASSSFRPGTGKRGRINRDTGSNAPGGVGVGASDGGMTGGAGGVGVGAGSSGGSGGGADGGGGDSGR
jgi:hypothetical protein